MQPPVSHIKSSPVSSTEIASVLRKEFKYWGTVPKWHQSEPTWPHIDITDVQRPGKSSTPGAAGDTWSRWKNGEGRVKSRSAPSGRHEKRCILGPTKWCSSGYLSICCPSDPRAVAPACGAAVSARTAIDPRWGWCLQLLYTESKASGHRLRIWLTTRTPFYSYYCSVAWWKQ